MKSLAEVIIEPILKDAEGSAVDLDFDDPDPGWEQDHHDDVDEDYVENGDEDDDEIDEVRMMTRSMRMRVGMSGRDAVNRKS